MKKHKTCTKIGLGGVQWSILGNYQLPEQGASFDTEFIQPLELIYKYFCKGYRNIHIYYFGVSARLDKCELICTLIERLAD